MPPDRAIRLYDRHGLEALVAAVRRQGLTATIVDAAMARGVQTVLDRRYPHARSIAVLVGAGGNGRQAQAVGMALAEQGRCVTYLVPDTGVGDAATLADYDVIVEGLVGRGLHGALSDPLVSMATALARAARPVVALDVPAGVDVTTGAVANTACRAAVTCACGAASLGTWTGVARDYCGDIVVVDTGMHDPDVVPAAQIPAPTTLAASVPRRPVYVHKGDAGTVVVAGGDRGMPGAVRLAAVAAYRIGAGLVGALVHDENAAPLAAACPELMAFATEAGAAFVGRADVVLIGSGLGRTAFGADLWRAATSWSQPRVIDGDGLYWLAQQPRRYAAQVLTPHEGEAARLLQCSARDVRMDRPGACRAIQQRYDGICVLKGSGTLISDGTDMWLCPHGNAGMATAGMGDALAGVIVGLIAQGLPLVAAAQLGVWLHARAGDTAAAQFGDRGFITSDVIAVLPACLRSLLSTGR